VQWAPRSSCSFTPTALTPRSTRPKQEFHRLEALLSRFRPDSELSRLNRDGVVEAGHDLLRVVTLSLDGRERTGGRFDPTVHDALVGRRLRPHVRRCRVGSPVGYVVAAFSRR